MNTSRRGFVFTIDAFVALVLVAIVIGVIIYQLNIPSAFFPQQVQTYDYARDVVGTLSTLTIADAAGQSSQAASYPESERGHTVLEQIAKEALTTGGGPRAELLAQELLADNSQSSPMIPRQFGAKILVYSPATPTDPWREVMVRDMPFTKIQSSASYVMLGYLGRSRNANTDPMDALYDYPPGEASTDKVCYNPEAEEQVPCIKPTVARYDPGEPLVTFVRVIIWV